MKQITKVVVNKGQINIYNSSEIVDKRTHYDIVFNDFYKGYTDYYINKEYVSSNSLLKGQLGYTMYISTSKFNKNKDYWINLLVDTYKSRYGSFKWYREPVIQ
ncbi:hypothetical protein [Lysinibacillus sp. BPa_S21]|uniref:hypothetical protein n=1 Tax=Lysinibacillus sp. BPa_S21 TaxID=2932478 RepID=UPI0020117FB1|nr:hypothetical protein [Lysinibacillus sp. BPa_S21]MCL1696350.1 hypothetical protein [Lysinibacillus sp. BPa_S21]